MAWWIFQNVVITSAFVAVIAMVCRTGRIGPVARHALWVLVLVKFVTPPVVVWPWAAPDPFGLAISATHGSSESTTRQTDAIKADPAGGSDGPAWNGIPATSPAGRHSDAASAGLGATMWPWLMALWIAGSVCLAAIESVRLVRLARRRRHSALPEPSIVQRVTLLAARLDMPPVPVVMVEGGFAPVVWGVGRPQLLLPSDLSVDSSDACIDGLIVHELAHVKRGDHLVGWIELAAGVVWWWNPLFWYARAALREQAELACDAWVVSTLPNGRRAYAESLLVLSGAAIRGASSSLAVVGIRATSRRVLERRLVMIMQGRSPLRLSSVGLCSLALVAAATLPAWATSQQPVLSPLPQVLAPVEARPAQPPVPVRRAVQRQLPPAPSEQRVVAPVTTPPQMRYVLPRFGVGAGNLPVEGQELLEVFDTEQKAIQAEADQKVAARREAVVKALEALQDKYARAGQLDEAVAIRDYLRAGGPNSTFGSPFGPVQFRRGR
jgi:beta-lactamase regulating signal transducer with metallopeptidase domain